MPNRSYNQLCPIARSLDVLGERWTLLVIRELLLGPKRFKELQISLPSMGPNRLSDRLVALVEEGVIRQVEGPPQAYELTEMGERLRKPVLALGLWSVDQMIKSTKAPKNGRAELIALCLTGACDPDAAKDLREIYEFIVGDSHFHVRAERGTLLARSGPPSMLANAVIECDFPTFVALSLRQVTPAQAVRSGNAILRVGAQSAFTRAFRLLGYKAERAV